MKRIVCMAAALLLVASVAAQLPERVYNREIAAGCGALVSADSGGEAVLTYRAQLTHWNSWNGGWRVGVNYADIPYAESMFVSVPLHVACKVDVPWFVGFDIFDDFFWSLAIDADTFGEQMFYLVAGVVVAFLPKSFELSCGISPGYSLSNSDNRTYYTGDILTRNGFNCSADVGVRATAKLGRLGFFIAPQFSWQMVPNIYYHDAHYNEKRIFFYYNCGLSFAF